MKAPLHVFIFLVISTVYISMHPLFMLPKRASQGAYSTRSRSYLGTQSNIRQTSLKYRNIKSAKKNLNQFTQSKYFPKSLSNGFTWLKNRIHQFFLGKTTTDIVQEIRSANIQNRVEVRKNFLDFIKQDNQSNVDFLLDELVIFDDAQKKDKEIEFLEDIMGRIIAFDALPDQVVTEKIANWISLRLMNLLALQVIKKDSTMKENYITKEGQECLAELIIQTIGAEYIIKDKKNGEMKPIVLSTVEQNIENICKTDTGLLFLLSMEPTGNDLLESDLIENLPRYGKALITEWKHILAIMQQKYNILKPILEKTSKGKDLLKKIQPRFAIETNQTSTITNSMVIE